jgi:hypothetical protein
MLSDPSWDIMPVTNPELPGRKQRRLIRNNLVTDPVGLPEPLYQLHQRDQIVAPSALDRASRELVIRAQTAIAVALDSVLDDAAPSADILPELRDVSDLRAEHEFNAATSAGPLTDSVLGPQQRALQLAHDAIESRVAALERYAGEVRRACAAFRDLDDALRIANLNDRYLGLVAHTAADEHAVTEISGLTDQASTAAQAARESMHQVGLAAAALALPEPATG